MKVYRPQDTWGWCFEFAETEHTHTVRFFLHGNGVGFLAIAADYDFIIGFIRNGIGAWRWINNWEPVNDQ